jgi:formyl transferase-like protein
MKNPDTSSVVLICHESDRLDSEGLASWLACTMQLRGLVVIRDTRRRLWRAARREIRRVGWLRFLDVIAYRIYARLVLAAGDEAWKRGALRRLRQRYPAELGNVPRLIVASPNSEAAREFLALLAPDLLIARCKFILKPSVFGLARVGAFALHPGICPEYRNAHGCFWALVNRDLQRVGMTLLRLDEGIDTGPVYLHATCPVDEIRESHTVIQYRVVLDNLDAIGRCLIELANGDDIRPIQTAGRASAVWGQPRLIDYLRWKWTARRRRNADRVIAVP